MEARGNGNNYNQPLPKPYVLDVHSIKEYGPPRSKFVTGGCTSENHFARHTNHSYTDFKQSG